MDAKMRVMLMLTALVAFTSSVAAADINWTEISSIVENSAVVITAIAAVIIAIVPIMILLAIVGFITGVFSGVLGGIQKRI